MKPIIDPRRGDIEDDASSTKRRSMLSLAGSLLAEISLPKLVVAWTLLIGLPGLMLGLAPIVASIWLNKVFDRLTYALAGIWSALLLLILVAVGWFAGRRLLRLAEQSFWSLNSLAVQPCYTAFRELLHHLVGNRNSTAATGHRSAALHASTALASGIIISMAMIVVLAIAWPKARLLSDAAILTTPGSLAIVALANSTVLICAYVAVAALVWAVADATVGPPRDLEGFATRSDNARTWRIAHLSDIHVVSGQYGFRIESGRSGPRGNARLDRVFSRLERIHADQPLDAVLITGDMTDAGLSTEWAEFLDAVERHPALGKLLLILPGNHDLNIVDRANPARLDLPTSANKRLRKARALSAMAAIQGDRVRIVDQSNRRLGETLGATLAMHQAEMATFADAGKPRSTSRLSELWTTAFPLVLPPDRNDGLGIILLNSNADTHFSFTNALGLLPAEQVRGIEIAMEQYPHARWIIALHHHLVEYPRAAKALSERIGTALINGNWFIRRLQRVAGRVLLMHGHRHIDWIGTCAGLTIVSAPSPMMEVTNERATHFYIHTLAAGPGGWLALLQPERITIAGEPIEAPEAVSLSAESEAPRLETHGNATGEETR